MGNAGLSLNFHNSQMQNRTLRSKFQGNTFQEELLLIRIVKDESIIQCESTQLFAVSF